MRAIVRLMLIANALALLFVAAWFFAIPCATVVRDVSDPALQGDAVPSPALSADAVASPALSGPDVPRAAWRLFASLTPRYERWSRAWVASKRGEHTPVSNISGSEWPVFGSFYYLLAVEQLQAAWEQDPSQFSVAPKLFARGAVDAAKDLILDRQSAGWVIKYWGDDYLTREDVFYRMLIIGALTTHHRLTGETRHLDMLRAQVESLAAELDASRTGLLDDYPGQCYNTDVVAAVAMIRRADAVLATDHSEFAARALRGFEGRNADALGLVPFQSESKTGQTLIPARGSSNSYLCIFAPEIWPDAAARWYGLYERHYWQRRWMADGFREFPRDDTRCDWWLDVDAGPVLAGHGVSACAFGLAAARVNGRFDHARPLAAETIAISWPLPDGTLAMPRLLSDALDAPFVGEASILYALTCRPGPNAELKTGGVIPPFVGVLIALYALAALYVAWLGVRTLRKLRRVRLGAPRAAAFQFVLWLALAVIGAVLALKVFLPAGMLLILVALGMPFGLPKNTKA